MKHMDIYYEDLFSVRKLALKVLAIKIWNPSVVAHHKHGDIQLYYDISHNILFPAKVSKHLYDKVKRGKWRNLLFLSRMPVKKLVGLVLLGQKPYWWR